MCLESEHVSIVVVVVVCMLGVKHAYHTLVVANSHGEGLVSESLGIK